MADTNSVMLNIILILLLIVKIIWVLALFSKFIDKKFFNNKYQELIIEVETIAHNIYTLLIGGLLVYLYNHLTPSKVCVEGHLKMYLYSFGILSSIGIIQKAVHKFHFDEDLTRIEKYILGK